MDAEEAAICSLACTGAVIAPGGSAVCRAGAIGHLRALGRVVYLHVPLPELERRIHNITTRGIAMAPGQTLADLYAYRAPLYERFAGAAAEMRQLTEAQDWEAAAHRLTALQQEWEDTLPGLQMQLNHEDTDELTLAMRTLEAGIRTQSAPLCALGCTQMEESAQHLSHRDAFNWANIL